MNEIIAWLESIGHENHADFYSYIVKILADEYIKKDIDF